MMNSIGSSSGLTSKASNLETTEALPKWIKYHNPPRASYWPGRLDPCDSSHNSIATSLQQLVDTLQKGGLTEHQHAQVFEDLKCIRLRAICEGYAGPKTLTIQAGGQSVDLDSIDLSEILEQIAVTPATVQHFVQAAESRARKAGSERHIRKPMVHRVQENNQDEELFPLKNLVPKSPFYEDLRTVLLMGLNRCPPTFTPSQQQLAKQVIDRLPLSSQGILRGVPAQLIGVDAYRHVLRAAAHENALPPTLQTFRDKIAGFDELKLALYTHPELAATLLGIQAKAVEPDKPNSELAKIVADDVCRPPHTSQPISLTLSNLTKKLTGQESLAARIRRVFEALCQFGGFDAQPMKQVMACFHDIPCPKASSAAENYHANQISVGNDLKAIAAMQPMPPEGADATNLVEFLNLVGGQPNTTVIDLRSYTDFNQGNSFDYCPAPQTSKTWVSSNGDESVHVSTQNLTTSNQSGLRQAQVQIQRGSNPAVSVHIQQFREWPDHGVVRPEQLRDLRKVALHALDNGQRLIVHCRAGVGRTGTVLCYSSLYRQLIEQGQGAHLLKPNGQVKSKELLRILAAAVAQGRIERGSSFVQTLDQFKLIYKTLAQDLTTHADRLKPSERTDQAGPADSQDQGPQKGSPKPLDEATVQSKPKSTLDARATTPKTPGSMPGSTSTPPTIPAVAAPESASPTLGHATRPGSLVTLSNLQSAQLAPEPKSTGPLQQHWAAILDQGGHAVEIVSDASRLALTPGQQPPQASQNQPGLGQLIGHLLNNQNSANTQSIREFQAGQTRQLKPGIQIGDHTILSIRRLQPSGQINKQTTQQPNLLHAQQFEITYQSGSKEEPKTLHYTQVLTPFDGKMLTAAQLEQTIELLDQSPQAQANWVTSAVGKGRTSALLTAQALREGILNGSISSEQSLSEALDGLINQGRQQMGPLFIHTSAQKEQLLRLGQAWLNVSQHADFNTVAHQLAGTVTHSKADATRAAQLKAML